MFHSAQSVVFIDANVSDVQHLVNGVLPGVAVKVLAPDTDGIAQITDYLAVYPASTVHVVSHGAPGVLFLGNNQLNLTNLENHAQALRSWFSAQISNPTLLLYGCNVAAGDAGDEFIHKLQNLTGANLAASRQVIGQGYWSLEVSHTNTVAIAPFNTAVLATWAGKLSHFRGGLIAWIPNDTDGDGINDDALITVKTAWAQNSVNSISSLGNLTGITQTLVSNDIVNITTANTGTYSFQTTLIQADNFDLNTAYTGTYSGGNRIGNLLNNSNGSWNIQSTFFLADGNRAPQIDLPILVDVPTLDASGNPLADWTYSLAVVDPDGDNVVYRLANLTELGGGGQVNPSGFSIDSSTGLLTWTGSGNLPRGLYSAGLVVEDLDSSGNVKSKSHVDFILNLTNLQAALVDVNGDITEDQTTVNIDPTGTINFSFGGGVTAQALSNSGGALTGTSPSFTYNASTVGAGVYPVTFRVSQSGFADSYKTYNFVIADANAPAITGIGGDIVTWSSEPVAIDSGGNAMVSYPGGSDLNGGFLRINPAFVDVGELVQVNNEGTGTGQISISGSDVLYEGQVIGTIDGTENGNGKALLINFTTAAATPAAIEALISNITYTNGTEGEPTDGNRSISIVLSDGSISNNYTSNVNVAHIDNFPPTGGVTIDGTIAQGQTLTANTSTLADADGLGTLSYQWQQSSDGITWNNIDGATDVSFSPRNGQVGQRLQVSVSYVDVFGTPESVTSAPTSGSVQKFNATSDFNGDGSVDIFWRHQTAGQSVFWSMDNINFSRGDFLSTSVTDANWDMKALGDLNGDGQTDLIWQHKVSNQVAVWLMDGVNLESSALLPTDGTDGWKVVESGDFNNNGKDDILWRNASTGQLAVWFMDGTDFLSGELINVNPGIDWEVGAVGDFTKDGKVDIFWEHRTASVNVFWEMDGTTLVDGYVTTAAEASWKAKGAADFNQDGNLELLWHNPGSGENVLWLMDGTNLVEGVALPTTEVNWNPVV